MEANDRAQRIVALKAIKAKAEEMVDSGASPIEVRTFIQGSRGELARQKPDWEQYAKAINAAEAARNTF
jgi:hypothetical protein